MQELIRKQINQALKDLNIEGVNFEVDHPTDAHTEADYFSNVALVVAKKAGEVPQEIAKQIVDGISEKIEHVSSIEIAGPGFLNFTLERDFYSKQIKSVLAAPTDWGQNDSWSGKKVLVEYTDPNPFKEFHIGHLFTNAVGESISRLFMMSGADTKRINYQGDVGLHVACAIWGMQKLAMNPAEGLTAKDLGKAYATGATANKENETTAQEIRVINKQVYERSDETVNEYYDVGRKVSLEYFESIYEVLGTKFDEYFFESEAGPKGKEIVKNHPDIFTESDGAYIFDGEKHGLHTRVFLNQEGLPTYEAKELALAKMKEDRLGEYDHSVVSTANEINEYFKVLLKAMSFVYPGLAEKTEHIGHGMVRLSTGKMSSRTGDVISALDFIDEVAASAKERMEANGHTSDSEVAKDVAVAAIKYETLKGNIRHDSVFDKESALSFEGDSGPYLQYTHARICSVLEKANAVGVSPETKLSPEVPYEIEKLIYQFPEAVEEALNERAPHKVTQYLTALAGEFNSFYAQEKIADSTDEFAPYKAAVADAVCITLKNGLWTLGIKAPKSM